MAMEAVSELSVGHDLVTESVVEPSICPVSLYGPDHELSTCDVSVSEPGCELSAFSVGSRGTVDEVLVFPAFETINAMYVFCVSVFPRLQSLLWVPDP